MLLKWVKCKKDLWCSLIIINLNHAHFDYMEGVYVIWYKDTNHLTIRVGQGIIRDRLMADRYDIKIIGYGKHDLWVTWAKVSKRDRDGVEAYLVNVLQPMVGAGFPDRTPIEVNLPW